MLGMVASGVSLALAGWSSPKSAKADPGLLRPSTLEISALWGRSALPPDSPTWKASSPNQELLLPSMLASWMVVSELYMLMFLKYCKVVFGSLWYMVKLYGCISFLEDLLYSECLQVMHALVSTWTAHHDLSKRIWLISDCVVQPCGILRFDPMAGHRGACRIKNPKHMWTRGIHWCFDAGRKARLTLLHAHFSQLSCRVFNSNTHGSAPVFLQSWC